jgi:fido (protein-threonine AMPylation protein)
MGLILDYSGGQTPLDEDEKEGLLIQTIATREELDEFEQLNIEEALQWVITKSFNAETVLTEKFICNLHKRMYGSVWSWAGKFRKTNKNLGVDKWQIPLANIMR